MAEEKVEKAVPTEEITDQDKLMAALAYLIGLIVSAIILLSEDMKARAYQRYHAIQSLGLWVAAVIYEVLATIVYCALSAVTGGILACCLWMVFFLPLIPVLYYTYLAYQGQYFDIPILTDFMVQQKWLERP